MKPTTTKTTRPRTKPTLVAPAPAPEKPEPKKVRAKITTQDYRKVLLKDDARLHLLVAENPWGASTKGHAFFAKYQEGMTVKEAVKAGVPRGYIKYDIAAERIMQMPSQGHGGDVSQMVN